MLILCDAPPPSLLLLLLLIFDVDNIFYSRAVEIIPCDGSETIVVLVVPTQNFDLVERNMEIFVVFQLGQFLEEIKMWQWLQALWLIQITKIKRSAYIGDLKL